MQTHTSVRRLRKAARLAQHEVAELLGVGQSTVSRIEAGDLPETSQVFGLQILFDVGPHHIFEGRFLAMAEEIVRKAAEMDQRLQRRGAPAHGRTRTWLREMMNRINVRPA